MIDNISGNQTLALGKTRRHLPDHCQQILTHVDIPSCIRSPHRFCCPPSMGRIRVPSGLEPLLTSYHSVICRKNQASCVNTPKTICSGGRWHHTAAISCSGDGLAINVRKQERPICKHFVTLKYVPFFSERACLFYFVLIY